MFILDPDPTMFLKTGSATLIYTQSGPKSPYLSLFVYGSVVPVQSIGLIPQSSDTDSFSLHNGSGSGSINLVALKDSLIEIGTENIHHVSTV